MFLKQVISQNPALVQAAFALHNSGELLPDTYILDLDMIRANAAAMKQEADRYGIQLYFMTKQLGRCPAVARALQEIGLAGAVCVDYKEALTLARNRIPLGNVGHLVQIPQAAQEEILAAHPDIVTVYSVEKAAEIEKHCAALHQKQDIMLRVYAPGDRLYPGQYGGFPMDQLANVVQELEKFSHLTIAGVCSFPCFLYDEDADDILPTHNAETVQRAAALLKQLGHPVRQINMPSATCTHTIRKIAELGGTHGEPGHGLTGTTPYHAAHSDTAEKCAYVYLSEVSHNVGKQAFAYGGGHYRRGHVQNALVGKQFDSAQWMGAIPPDDESIDYHFTLTENANVGDAVVMCFRTQIFVTRSNVAVIEGLQTGHPHIEGIYTALGEKIR